MRIKITKGGIFGQPTKENPSGELAIGTELTLNKAPDGWAGRYIDLDSPEPEGEDTDALKARIAELEGQVKERDDLLAKGSTPVSAYAVTEKNPGWFVITQEGKEVTKALRKDAVKDFDGLPDADKAALVDLHKPE